MSQQLKFQGEEESNLATREPAKPLKDAQMRGALFVYTHLNMANLIPFTKRFEFSHFLTLYIRLKHPVPFIFCDF